MNIAERLTDKLKNEMPDELISFTQHCSDCMYWTKEDEPEAIIRTLEYCSRLEKDQMCIYIEDAVLEIAGDIAEGRK